MKESGEWVTVAKTSSSSGSGKAPVPKLEDVEKEHIIELLKKQDGK